MQMSQSFCVQHRITNTMSHDAKWPNSPVIELYYWRQFCGHWQLFSYSFEKEFNIYKVRV